MLRCGLTGGIGSGKSTAAAGLARRGAVVVDADAVARRVVEPGRPAYEAVVARFGPGVVLAGGGLDRPALAAVVFSDPAARADLEAITHPAIRTEVLARAAGHEGTDAVVVLDLPLLDAGSRAEFGLDAVVVVDCPVEVAVARLVGQRGLTEADARARVAAQMGRAERRALADVVVDNSGDRRALDGELDRAWGWMRGRRRRDR